MDGYQKFLHQFRTKRFKKGEIILVQGEVPECTYIVKDGIIKTYNLTSQGEEKPIGFDLPGEAFPISWIFRRAERVQYYYEAFSDAEVYCIPVKDYLEHLKIHPTDLMSQLESFVSRYMCNQMRINALEQSKATPKVVNTLHYLCLRYGHDLRKDVVKIQLPLTQQDLANFIGLTRETTGIELKKLHRNGVLTYRKQSYVVHTDKLNELLDEDYGLGMAILAGLPAMQADV